MNLCNVFEIPSPAQWSTDIRSMHERFAIDLVVFNVLFILSKSCSLVSHPLLVSFQMSTCVVS
jgi:hypothetical protein